MIIVGDYNIAHREIDIHDPKGNKNSSGFLPEERAWLTRWFENGFTDAFRFCHPDTVEYSWWSFRAGSRGNNKGWRIDYQSVTDNLSEKIISAGQLTGCGAFRPLSGKNGHRPLKSYWLSVIGYRVSGWN